MYPVITFPYIDIYLFWVGLMVAWVLFFYGLHRRSIEAGITKHIFSRITLFTLSIFIFSRMFYILWQWRIERFIFEDFLSGNDTFITFLERFFLASGTGWYNLSFAGGVVGFVLVFLWLTRKQKKIKLSYLDIILPAFFVAAIAGYIGALLGGQIYGIPFDSFFSIQYAHKFNIVPLQKALFPLPVLYILMAIIGVVWNHFLQKKQVPKGFIGAVGIWYVSSVLFIFEFLSGDSDTFASHIWINMTQILALFGIWVTFWIFFKILRA